MNMTSMWAAALLLVPWAADAQQPPHLVVSDAYGNTATGTDALLSLLPGGFNNGSNNTAAGYQALSLNTTGYNNTASGVQSLEKNTTGQSNTAYGVYTLQYNTTGYWNTAAGVNALNTNTIGYSNTAYGIDALLSNTSGYDNVAYGVQPMYSNTAGYNNTAVGTQTLFSNISGINNTALGYQALYSITAGGGNSAIGQGSLTKLTSGRRNTAVGMTAGQGLNAGSYNTYIGWDATGGSAENYVTRIGVTYQDPAIDYAPTTYITGIYGNVLSGETVVVTSSGQLGVLAVSSEQFKTAIATMGSATEKLSQLRPVTFKLKSDAQGTVHYGLIAEEVARVYPELVIRNEDGRIDSVHYEELAPMLLNEMQKQQQANAVQAARIALLEQQVTKVNDLEREISEMHAALAASQTRDQLGARR